MADFERFLTDNDLRKKDVAEYLQVSKAFVTQLCQGLRKLPPEKLALLKTRTEWDTSALLESDQPSDQSIRGNVTRIGNISGVTNSPTTVKNNGGGESADLMRVIEELKEQNKSQREQIQNLTEIIKNLTAR
jgi:hypothetical protein